MYPFFHKSHIMHYFFLPIMLVKTTNTMLTEVVTVALCSSFGLKRKSFTIPLLSMTFLWILCQIRGIPCYIVYFLKINILIVLNFIKYFFCINWNNIIVFLLYSIIVTIWIVFLNAQSSIPELNSTRLYVWSFIKLLDLAYFVLAFYDCLRETGLKDSFLLMFLYRLTSKSKLGRISSFLFPGRAYARLMLHLPQILRRIHQWSHLCETVFNYRYKRIHILKHFL